MKEKTQKYFLPVHIFYTFVFLGITGAHRAECLKMPLTQKRRKDIEGNAAGSEMNLILSAILLF